MPYENYLSDLSIPAILVIVVPASAVVWALFFWLTRIRASILVVLPLFVLGLSAYIIALANCGTLTAAIATDVGNALFLIGIATQLLALLPSVLPSRNPGRNSRAEPGFAIPSNLPTHTEKGYDKPTSET